MQAVRVCLPADIEHDVMATLLNDLCTPSQVLRRLRNICAVHNGVEAGAEHESRAGGFPRQLWQRQLFFLQRR
jgi:hypothetical protein